MPSPTYQVNKPYQIAYIKRNREKHNEHRRLSYLRKKCPLFREFEILRRMSI